MATNDVNLQVINSMTQTKMNSLKDADGKIPSLANQLIITDEEDANLSQIRTELLWINPNTTATFNEQTINVDLSKYDGYRVIFGFHTTTTMTFVQEFCKTDGVITALSYNSIFRRNITYSDDGLTFSMMEGYKIPGETIIQNNDYLIPYKIEGVLKTPSMIYTGVELHEGNGIGIDNGVISSKFDFVGNYNSTTSMLSIDIDLANYDYLTFVSHGRGQQGNMGIFFNQGLSWTNKLADGTNAKSYVYLMWSYSFSSALYIRYDGSKTLVQKGDSTGSCFAYANGKPNQLTLWGESGSAEQSYISLYRRKK